jgi:hypothetical protein
MHGLCVGDREARADCQCGELIDRIAAGAPVRELLFVEALGDTRVPFARYRPDHRAGVELGTIDAHRAAEAAADASAGVGCGGPFRSSSLGQVGAQGPQFDADKTVRLHMVSDPAADNRLRFGPACRALDVSPCALEAEREKNSQYQEVIRHSCESRNPGPQGFSGCPGPPLSRG